jgi:AcrR family transcriptional regulator
MPARSSRGAASSGSGARAIPGARGKPRKPAQKRRPPEEARQALLEAALRVFRDHHPDEVGLKEVAREAGVSHALVTHYFGSFGGLVDAVLESRVVALREQMLGRLSAAGALERPGELLGTLFEALADPVYKRLWVWALATERAAAADFFPLRHQGLRLVVEQVTASVAATTGASASALQPEVERTLLAGVAAAYGYTMGKQALVGALGKPPSREMDRALEQSLGDMMREHVLRHAESLKGEPRPSSARKRRSK